MPATSRHDDSFDLIPTYRQTVGELYAFVRRRCTDQQLGEDVVQETYMRAVRDWRLHGLPESPIAWLKTVARNLLVTYHRRRRPVATDPESIDHFLDHRRGTGQAAELVSWGLAQLKPQAALLIEAFHLDGKPLRHIANELGLTERAIEGKLYRARQALRTALSSHVTDAEDPPHDRN
ncbi:MAG: RNA polymerase sigma factor [Planctomycetota bacterium]|jgi:RNA polymerase sigma-70 factor (ECF subfamily)